MHPYATDSPANPKLLAGLALVAAAASALVGTAVASVNSTLGWNIGGLSAMSCFGLLYLLFDRSLWKLKWVRRFLLVPDLNGEWRCSGVTVSKAGTEKSEPWNGTVRIRQSWSRMAIVLSTEHSSSRSIAASVYRDSSGGFRLIYHYDNDPNPQERELSRHTGLCRLVFDDSGSSASGNYFTDRDRMTVGTMSLARKGT
jgi:hypothetical protein